MKNKILPIIFWSISGLIFILSIVVTALTEWFNLRFGVSFEEILFTLSSPLAGSDTDFMGEAISYILKEVLLGLPFLVGMLVFAFILRLVLFKVSVRFFKLKFKFDFYNIYKFVCLILSCILLYSSISFGVESLEIDKYIAQKLDSTTVYEEYYVDPESVEITYEGTPKNLLFIYLESMETTYASTDIGGHQDVNYIPKLTALANENTYFSHNDQFGGLSISTGTTWTMAALFSSTAGVPFSFPVEGNSFNERQEFASGITTLGDVLDSYGYNQTFLCGSDGSFGGRQLYFEQHGNYDVFDYYSAVDKGYIDEDYWVWWGYEDLKLFDIAKAELLEISQKDEPFNYTMLTVDAHHVDGYICENCKDTYPHQLGNVLECGDSQLYDFILWCQEQDFYEDTTIVIMGDHPRMDTSLVGGIEERTLYNCFINSEKETTNTKNRVCTSLDMFPTTLSAMGFSIEGDRLGLGTDLFSERATLSEEFGLDELNNELAKHSSYYINNFN